MLPSAFVPLEALPLTPNGKLDRQALPSPDGARQETATPFVPPATEVERKLAAIFQELLGMNEIGVDDNFFDLGANSLMMVRVVEKIRAELGWTPSVTFEQGLERTVNWYLTNQPWWQAILDKRDATARRGHG